MLTIKLILAALIAATPAKQVDSALDLLNTPDYKKGLQMLEKTVDSLRKQLPTEDAQKPEHAETHFQLARALYYLRKDEDAMSHAGRAVRLKSSEPRYPFFRGKMLLSAGKPKEAVNDFARAAELEPDNDEYLCYHGTTLGETGKTEEALEVLAKAAKLDPKNPRPVFLTGIVFTGAGKNDEALKMFLRAAEIDPRHRMARFNAGQLYQNLGKHEQALKMFLDGAKLAPSDIKCRGKIIQLYDALGKKDKRDEERARLIKEWESGKYLSWRRKPFYVRDQFKAGDKKVMTLEYFRMSGEMAVKYVFYVLEPKTEKILYRLSLGSYETTNAIARETGEIKPDERLYHLDQYDKKGHRLYRMYKGEPKYDDVKKLVIKAIQGKAEMMSGTFPGRQPETKPAKQK
jgi:tetratricopeptide (TPR) repeat protein